MESDDPLSDIDVSYLRGLGPSPPSPPRPRGILLSRCINCGRVLHQLALFCKCNPDEIAEVRTTREIVNCGVCDRELPDHHGLCPAEGRVPEEYEVQEEGRIIVAKYDKFLRENGIESVDDLTYLVDSNSEEDFESEGEYVYEGDFVSEGEYVYGKDSDSEREYVYEDLESEEEYVYERDLESEEEGGNHYLRRTNRIYAGLGDIFNDDEEEEEEEEEEVEYDSDDSALLDLMIEMTRPCIRNPPNPTDRPVRQ